MRWCGRTWMGRWTYGRRTSEDLERGEVSVQLGRGEGAESRALQDGAVAGQDTALSGDGLEGGWVCVCGWVGE